MNECVCFALFTLNCMIDCCWIFVEKLYGISRTCALAFDRIKNNFERSNFYEQQQK